MQARHRGTTLIELSVVIAVLLLLVGVLFIGITAWKSGAKQGGMRHQPFQYSKGGSRISKHEPADYGRNACGSYPDERWLLAVCPGLSRRRHLLTFRFGPISRNSLHDLQRFRSRTFANDFGELVNLES